jgi:hypothetical protein
MFLGKWVRIELCWIRGVLSKGRELFAPIPLFPKAPQPCFVSNLAR